MALAFGENGKIYYVADEDLEHELPSECVEEVIKAVDAAQAESSDEVKGYFKSFARGPFEPGTRLNDYAREVHKWFRNRHKDFDNWNRKR